MIKRLFSSLSVSTQRRLWVRLLVAALPVLAAVSTARARAAGTNEACASFGNCEAEDFAVTRTNTSCTTPPVNAGTSAAACSGDTFPLGGAAAQSGVTYTWTVSPAIAGFVLTAAQGTVVLPTATTATIYTFTLTATTGPGCTATSTVQATVNPVALATIIASGSTLFCQGGGVVLTASSGTAYAWSNGATTASIAVSTGGSYTVTTTNAAGCSATSAATVVAVVPPPTVTATASLPQVCAGAPVLLTGLAVRPPGVGSNLVDTYTYRWTGPGIPTAGITGATLTVRPTTLGVNTYTLVATGTAQFNCSNTTTVQVTVVPPPTVAATRSLPQVCAGAPVLLSASAVRPPGAGSTLQDTYAYAWSGPGVPSGTTGSTLTVAPTTLGVNTYTVTATGTSQFGCSNTATVQVTVVPPPTVVATTNNAFVCSGSPATLTAAASNPALNDTYIYTWTGNGVPVGTTGAALTVRPTATTTYTVSAVGGASTGCAATSTVTVQVNPTPPTPVVTRNGPVLNSSSPTGNQWYLNGTAITGAVGPAYTPTGPGTYTVVVFGAGNCPSGPSSPQVITAARGELAAPRFSLCPTPTRDGQLLLSLSGYRGRAELSVRNAVGQVVQRQWVVISGQPQPLHLAGLSAGVYVVILQTSDGLLTQRLVQE